MATTFTSNTTIKSSEVNANFLEKKARTYTTTATAAGTTTLLVTSNQQQFFTGVTTQTVTLPVASTMSLGYGFEIFNNSTGVVTVNSSGANLVQSMAAGSKLEVICILASGTTAASWQVVYKNSLTNSNPSVTKYTTGSGTYTTPSGAKYLQVEIVGGGGGGGGGGSGAPGSGGAGGNSTFGAQITATGGTGSSSATGLGGVGGTATGTDTANGMICNGGGGMGEQDVTTTSLVGGAGGSSFFGGAGASNNGAAGTAGTLGGGGGGGGCTSAGVNSGGGGGGAGGGRFIINSPSATYAYAVGAGGSAGAAGTNGGAGGAGGEGAIIITAYF